MPRATAENVLEQFSQLPPAEQWRVAEDIRRLIGRPTWADLARSLDSQPPAAPELSTEAVVAEVRAVRRERIGLF